MSVDLVRSKISEDAPVAEAEPEEQQMVDENSTGPLNPYAVFPDLVWLKISSKVQDTQDWLNLYFASSKLMDLLQKDMIDRVFPQVFCHLHKYLSRKDVINLCAADRKFESAIISWVQTRWIAPRWTGEGYDDPNYYSYYANDTAYSPVVDVDSREELQLLTKELLGGGSGSLIPFGIIFCDWREEDQFWDSVKTFLQLFGKRIWYCKLRYFGERFSDKIIPCLRLISNVIRLGLDFPYLISPAHSPKFPQLAKLKVLSLFQQNHKTLMDFLRLHADQLETLSIIGKDALEESFRYSNLKNLRLYDYCLRRVPLRFDLFSQALPTKVYADINAFGYAEFGRMFLQFNHFGVSLEDLELHGIVISMNFGDWVENDMTWTDNINLPKLKKMKLCGSFVGELLLLRIHSFQDTHFPFPNCERFLVTKVEEKINQIFDSDIWSILPNLEEVKICNSGIKEEIYGIYTRDEYNEYHQKPPNE